MTKLFDAKPFIIAEVGSNWRSLTDCCDSVKAARECGADAVKFQLFDEVALYGHGYSVPTYGGMVKPPFLPPAWLSKLKEVSDVNGIEFMCTAFSPEFVATVDPYVQVHKVASSDLCYPQLLKAAARTGKPVLLSTGAASDAEIAQAWQVWEDMPELTCRKRAETLCLLYCVAAYPADFVDLTCMDTLRKRSQGCLVGFSDHTLGYTATVEAARRGAIAIEKHFTAIEADTPDREHSLNPAQFKLMVDRIRGAETPIGPTPEEQAMLLRHKRRLIATKDLEAGTSVLTFGETYGAYRSLADDTHGLSPFLWQEVEGKIAQRNIKRGESIGRGDFGDAF